MDSERSVLRRIFIYFLIVGAVYFLLSELFLYSSDKSNPATPEKSKTSEVQNFTTLQAVHQVNVVNISQNATPTPRPFNLYDNDAPYYYDLGIRFFNNSNFEVAIRYYNYALALDDENPTYYLERGRAYGELKLLPLAANDYEQALRLGVNRETIATYFSNIGVSALNDRLYVIAIHYFDTAIELNPMDARNYYLKGQTYERAGNWQGALQNYEQVIGMDASLGYDILMSWGAVAQDTESHDLAITHFSRAIDLQPNNPEPYRNRAVSYCRLGQSVQCLNDLQAAVQVNPADPQNYNFLGWYYEQQGSMRLADSYYRHAQQVSQRQ